MCVPDEQAPVTNSPMSHREAHVMAGPCCSCKKVARVQYRYPATWVINQSELPHRGHQLKINPPSAGSECRVPCACLQARCIHCAWLRVRFVIPGVWHLSHCCSASVPFPFSRLFCGLGRKPGTVPTAQPALHVNSTDRDQCSSSRCLSCLSLAVPSIVVLDGVWLGVSLGSATKILFFKP